jgi:transcriptional regulator with XRE-family HTH domain
MGYNFFVNNEEFDKPDRLRLLRKKLGLNQGEFALKLGITQTALSMIEIGRSKLTEKNIKLISVTFNVNENWLRTGEGEMFAAQSPFDKELLDIFKRLTPGTQDFLLLIARALLEKQKQEAHCVPV